MKYYLITASLVCMATGALAQTLEIDPAQESWNTPGQASMPPPPPPQVQSVPTDSDAAYFYKSLQPHGMWIEVNPLGIVWRPHVAIKDSTWRPYYSGGQWVWVNNAWAWNSEYEWGWAPFHYGRWVMSTGLGWVWIPGREWSSAWVVWDKTPTQFGWAPMPPERSAYVGVYSTTDSGFSWGFQFGLTRAHYVYTPCHSFREVIVVHEPDYGCYDNRNYSRYDYRNYRHDNHSRDISRNDHQERPAPEVRRESIVVRTPEPSRRTSAMQQIVTRTAPAVANSSRPIQQVTVQPKATTQPKVNTPPRVTVPQTSGGNVSKGNSSSSDRRSSRLTDIISRSRK